MSSSIKKHCIGNYQDIAIQLVNWNSVQAEAELSCVCVFSHEMGQA